MTGTLPLAYVEQHAADLTFALFDAPAPRESITVLSERTLRLLGAEMTLAIIGSSHFLEIKAGRTVLCEMVACPHPGLYHLPRVVELAGQGPCQHRLRRGTVSYRFGLRRRRLTSDEFLRESVDLSAPGPNRLQYLFPASGRAGSAVTCLEWRLEDRRATVATYHTFPNELMIVQTRSVIDVSEGGAAA